MLTCQNLLSVISFVSGQPENEILGASRARGLVLCRHAYYHIAREKMGLKLAQIGAFFNRDHTTIIHGLTKVKDMLSIQDEITCNFIEQVNNCIREKYLIPTRIMVTIPHDAEIDKVFTYLELQGCEIDRISLNFDSMHT
jgi:hypothetical protein